MSAAQPMLNAQPLPAPIAWLWPDRRLGLLNLLHFCNDGFQYAFLAIPPFLAGVLGFNPLQIGYLTAAQAILAAAMAIPAAKAAARFNGVAILLAAMLVYGVTLLVTASVSGFASFLAVYLLSGIGFGMFHPVGFVLVARHAPRERSGSAMGTFTAIGDIGRFAIAGPASLLLATFAWQYVSIGLGVAALALAALLLVSLRDDLRSFRLQQDADEPQQPRRKFGPVAVLRQHKGFAGVCLIAVADALAGYALFVFLPLLLAAKCGLPFAGIAMTFFYASSLIGKAFFGRLTDRWGERRVLVACELGIFASAVGLCWFAQPAMLFALTATLGLFSKGTLPTLLSLSTKLLPREALGDGLGVHQLLTGLATAASPLLLGFVAYRFSNEAALAVVAALCLTIVLAMTISTLALAYRASRPAA